MLRAVLDSSVLVSGFLTDGGVTAALLKHYREGSFAVCSSSWIIAETERALMRPRNMTRYRYTPEDVQQFLDRFARTVQLVGVGAQVATVTRDPSDDQVIACAVAAGVHYLVTGDDDMLVLGEHLGVRIVTPRQFLDLLATP